MVTILQDPKDPQRLILSIAVTTYLDKVLLETLSDELEKSIRTQAVKDLQHSRAVKQAVAKAATEKLLDMLGYIKPSEVVPTEEAGLPKGGSYVNLSHVDLKARLDSEAQ